MATKKDRPKDPWKIATGHRPHITGAGLHDPRPNRQRSRSDAERAEYLYETLSSEDEDDSDSDLTDDPFL